MKVLVPFTLIQPPEEHARLPLIGFGELADQTGRAFRLQLDEERGRFVLSTAGKCAELFFGEVTAAICDPAAIDNSGLAHRPDAAACVVRLEDRPDAPELLRIAQVDGLGALLRAKNGWCLAVTYAGSEGARETRTLDVIHLATMVAAAAGDTNALSAGDGSTAPDNGPPASDESSPVSPPPRAKSKTRKERARRKERSRRKARR